MYAVLWLVSAFSIVQAELFLSYMDFAKNFSLESTLTYPQDGIGCENALLYILTADEVYLQRAHQSLTLFVEYWQNKTKNGSLPFQANSFTGWPVAFQYKTLKDMNKGPLWSQTYDDHFKLALADYCRPNHLGGAWNEGISAALATETALQLFPEFDENKGWKAFVQTTWEDWAHGHTYVENANADNGMFLCKMFMLSDILGKTDDLVNNGVRVLLEKYRDMIAPTASLPNYGGGLQDSSYPPSGFPEGACYFTAVFERAASLYNDPSFRWAANMFWRYANVDELKDKDCLLWITMARVWMNEALKPIFKDVSSTVLRRHEPFSFNVPDKLVVAPSRMPGSGTPYVMLELYPSSTIYHNNPMQVGALIHYEYDQTIFLYVGWSKQHPMPDDTNMPIMYPYSETGDKYFPYRLSSDIFKPDEYQINDQPTRRFQLASLHWKAYVTRHFNELSIVCPNPFKETIYLYIDHMELVGPNGTLLVDDFLNSVPWSNAEFTNDTKVGKKALKIKCAPSKITTSTRPKDSKPPLGYSFDVRNYTHLRYHWKMSSNYKLNDTCGCAVCDKSFCASYNGYKYIQWPFSVNTTYLSTNGTMGVLDITFFPEVINTKAETTNGDSYGHVNITAFILKDTQWFRQVILLQEGILIIADYIKPTVDQDGWLTGPQWKFSCTNHSSLMDGRWFDLYGFRMSTPGFHPRAPSSKKLIVYMGDAQGRTHGIVPGFEAPQYRLNPSKSQPYFTMYSKEKVKANTLSLFLTVMIPYDIGDNSKTIVDGITVLINNQMEAMINFKWITQAVAIDARVSMDIHGSWMVDRTS